MNELTTKFEWILDDQSKLRDGHHGPVFWAMDVSGQQLWAERLELEGAALEMAVSQLARLTQQGDRNNNFTIRYVGCQRKGDHTYLLTECTHAGHLHDFINRYAPIPVCLVRRILRGILLGLEQLYTDRGLEAVFPDLKHIWLDNLCNPRIEAPLIDPLVAGQSLPKTLLTLPKMASGQRDLRNVDTWLLGIIAAQLLSGNADLVADHVGATTYRARLEREPESAVELLLPNHSMEDPLTWNFSRQCLVIDGAKRPSLSEFREHPFLPVDERLEASLRY